jgi:hypothetical protein
VLEQLGQREAARAQYQDFLEHWGHADRAAGSGSGARGAYATVGFAVVTDGAAHDQLAT